MSATGTEPGVGKRTVTPLLILGGVLVVLLIAWLLLSTFPVLLFGPPRFHGTVLDPPAPAADFTLTRFPADSVSLGDFKDRVVLLYFGYTYCPDVCPTTLSNLARAKEKLGGNGDKVQVVMISVDPARDKPEALANYVASFDSSFIGLTGTPDEIAAVAKPYGIFYAKGEGTVKSGYLVDHTASVLVVDKAGNLRLVYSLDTPGDDIAADLRYLVRE